VNVSAAMSESMCKDRQSDRDRGTARERDRETNKWTDKAN